MNDGRIDRTEGTTKVWLLTLPNGFLILFTCPICRLDSIRYLFEKFTYLFAVLSQTKLVACGPKSGALEAQGSCILKRCGLLREFEVTLPKGFVTGSCFLWFLGRKFMCIGKERLFLSLDTKSLPKRLRACRAPSTADGMVEWKCTDISGRNNESPPKCPNGR